MGRRCSRETVTCLYLYNISCSLVHLHASAMPAGSASMQYAQCTCSDRPRCLCGDLNLRKELQVAVGSHGTNSLDDSGNGRWQDASDARTVAVCASFLACIATDCILGSGTRVDKALWPENPINLVAPSRHNRSPTHIPSRPQVNLPTAVHGNTIARIYEQRHAECASMHLYHPTRSPWLRRCFPGALL